MGDHKDDLNESRPLGLRVVKAADPLGDKDVAEKKRKDARRVKAEALTHKAFSGLKDLRIQDPFFNCKK